MESNIFHDSNNIKTNKSISKYCPDISLINSQLESDTGNTPLILSILSQDIKSFLELLSLGASPNITNYSGETPLHISINKGFSDYVILLLKYDVNPNIKNYLGQTAMHLAIINQLEENILQRLKEKNGDIYNIKDNFNKTPFDYSKDIEDKNYINILVKIFGNCKNKKNEKNKSVQTWNEKKLSDIINEIKNNSQSYNYNNNYKKINDKYYLDTLLNNHSERNQTKYEKNDIYETSKLNRLNSELNKKEIKIDYFTNEINDKENKADEKKKSINKKYTHGRAMLCSDLNSNNIQIKELNNSSENNYSEKSKKSSTDFLAEEINNLEINNYKGNFDIVDINNADNNNNKNINVSRIYSQRSENSALSKITEDKENSNMNSNIPFSHSSSRINTYKSDKSNLSNKQSLYQSSSLNNNKNIIKNIINDTVKKIEVKSITSSEGDNLSNLNILSKETEKNFSKKNNEFNINTNTNNDNCNLYENGTTSIVMYKNKNSNEINNLLSNKENKNINISNINEEINLITHTNKTDKTNKTNMTNKTNEFIQDNNINRNKTILISTLNNLNSSKNIPESSFNMKNNEIKDNIFLNSENSHIFSDLNTNTNNYNNISLSYSKNLLSEEFSKTNTKNASIDKKNELSIKNINNSNNSFHGSNYSNNTKKKRISNGNQYSSTGIKKSKSFIDSTSMKKSNFNKSIYNKIELENLNLKNNEINESKNDTKNKIGSNLSNFINDKIYKKHHRQLSYHINYKSGINNNNKDKELKRNNTKEIISNINALQTSGKKDKIYHNKNNIAYYSNTKSNNSENKNKNENINTSKNQKNSNKDSLIAINKSIKSLASTNNPNITVTHNIFANSITNTNNNNNNNNDSNLNTNTNNNNIKNRTKKNSINKIISGNNSNNNTAFSTLNKQNRLSKFSTNNNVNNIPKNNHKINNFNDDIIYNDDEYEDNNDYKCEIRNINTDVLLRLREFLLSCDLLCYFNLLIEKKLYKIDSYINDIQEGLTPLTYAKLENIGIKKPGHIYRILIKLDIDAGIIDNNLFNFIIEKINYRSFTTTTLAMTSSITDINCCGINICSNQSKFGNRKSGRNPIFNFSDLSSFLRLYNLTKFKGNFVYNGFDKIEFVLIQMFSKYIFDQKILNDYLHIYINKDKIKLLNKLYSMKCLIAKEFGIEGDYNEYNKNIGNKIKLKLNDKIDISNISNEKKSIRRNMSYIQNINNTYFNESNSIKNSINNDENTDISNQQNQNNCNIF